MIDRLFKSGLITTIIGLVIILVAVITWVFKDIPAAESVIIAGIGSGLLFVKDEQVGIGRK
jgi:hypothetical protein